MKYKKAPQAPRRFKSSYMFFSTEKHKAIRKELTEKEGGENEKVSVSASGNIVVRIMERVVSNLLLCVLDLSSNNRRQRRKSPRWFHRLGKPCPSTSVKYGRRWQHETKPDMRWKRNSTTARGKSWRRSVLKRIPMRPSDPCQHF